MFKPSDAESLARQADQLREQAAALIKAAEATPDGVDDAEVAYLLGRASALETMAWELTLDQHDAESVPAEEQAG